jgi:hypothetical protein
VTGKTIYLGNGDLYIDGEYVGSFTGRKPSEPEMQDLRPTTAMEEGVAIHCDLCELEKRVMAHIAESPDAESGVVIVDQDGNVVKVTDTAYNDTYGTHTPIYHHVDRYKMIKIAMPQFDTNPIHKMPRNHSIRGPNVKDLRAQNKRGRR